MSPRTNSVASPTGTVLFSGEDMKTRAYRYSFQESVKQKMNAETRPGTLSGRMTWKRMRRRLAPSTIAASSSSRGMLLRYPTSSQVQNGTRKVEYTGTSAQSWSNQPSLSMTSASGMKKMAGGMR